VLWWLYPAVLTLTIGAYLAGRWVGRHVGYERGRADGILEGMAAQLVGEIDQHPADAAKEISSIAHHT